MRSRLLIAVLALQVHAGFAQAPDNGEVGSPACSGCHAGIYRKYQATGMARTSGRAAGARLIERFDAASFHDERTGAAYKVTHSNDVLRLEYERAATAVSGVRDLSWFVGSGKVGRSYAFSLDGFLFQAPVSYYSLTGRWDLSPGFAGKPDIELARAIEPACLHCHSSRVQHVRGTQNQYRDPPFLEPGVSCERCHGPGRAHIEAVRTSERPGSLQIINPARLEPARRDSVCLQCHLTGAARVSRRGKGPLSFRPGDLLSDHVAVFVWAGGGPPERAATDHAEQLSRSRCRQSAGDKLWCGTCHDPHSQPRVEQRAAFYRASCLRCHELQKCTESAKARAASGDDCSACHMPKGRSREGEHVVYTDHTIARRPGVPIEVRRPERLVSFWKITGPERELALAYASMADSHPAFRQLAISLLGKLARADPDDTAVLSQLAQLYDSMGAGERALPLYERVLRIDPFHAAAANLAVHRMQSARSSEAIRLWQGVFSRNPALAGPGINLVVAHLGSGDVDAAGAALMRVLRFHPDLEIARRLLMKVRAAQHRRPE